MAKRIASAVLWFLAVAYAWNILATVVGISDTPAILLGAAAGLFIGMDPTHRIWSSREERTSRRTVEVVAS